MVESNELQRPKVVLLATSLLFGSLALGLLRSALDPTSVDPSLGTWFGPLVRVLTFAFFAGVYYLIFRGRNWARILFVAMFALGLLGLPSQSSQLFANWFRISVFVAQTLLQVVAIVLLFLPGARPWFGARAA